MDFSEKFGRDEEDAIRLCLDDLKASREDCIITIIEPSSKGFLGIGAKMARVRVEKKTPEQLRADAEALRQAQKVVEQNQRAAQAAQKAPTAAAPVQQNKPLDQIAMQSRFRGPDLRTKKPDQQAAAAQRSEQRTGRSEQRGERRSEKRSEQRSEQRDGRRRDQRPDRRREDRSRVYEGGPSKYTVDKNDPEAVAINDSAAVVFLQEVTSKMGLTLQVEAYAKDGVIYINMEGADSGTIIGKRGQTLDAIQYLTSLVVNKDEEKYIRVVVNAESYREKREQTLIQLAKRLSDKVKKSGKSVRLEPMNPYERKVIHATLQQSEHVTTRSEGEEPYRRVIIERK